MAEVSTAGVGMRLHPGVASRMFRTPTEEGLDIRMISASEIKIGLTGAGEVINIPPPSRGEMAERSKALPC